MKKTMLLRKIVLFSKSFPHKGNAALRALRDILHHLFDKFFWVGTIIEKKRLNFSTEIQFLINCSFVKLNCSCDKLAETFALKVWNFELKSRKWWKKLTVRKKFKLVLWRRKLQFWQHCRKKSATFKLLSALSPKMWKAIIFFKNFVLSPKRSSVQVKCTSDSRTETFLPKTWFIFCLKTKIDRKTITFFSNNPIFYQMVVCIRKKWFWQLRQKPCAKTVKILKASSQILKNMGNFKNVQEKNKIVFRSRKTQFFQQCRKNVNSHFFLYRPKKKIWKTKIFQKFCFSL